MHSQGSPLVIVAVIVIFAIAIGAFIYTTIKRREEVFEGEVIDKDVVENQTTNNYGPGMNRPGAIMMNNRGGVTHTYRIKVRTDQGKEIHYTISEGKYEIIKIGDRVSKPKGTTDVNIVSSAATTTTTPVVPGTITPTSPTPPAPPTVAGPTPPAATPPSPTPPQTIS